ncbi:MAG: cystathionine beta-lyase [Wolbachia endosymbiont of Menacanthus eurysternus]|nr:MAG: cystathionine beta-lyase [Wolbachia endosymbiont of Menacanthus eurysternus]
MREESLLIKAGRRRYVDYNGSMNPPIYHSSTILFPTYRDYLNAVSGKNVYDVVNDGIRDYSYSSVGTPTAHYFSEALAEIEGSGRALIYPSGLFALTFAILTFTKIGSHVLIQDNSYYRLRRFAENELIKRGIEITFYDPTRNISNLVRDNTSLIMIETPGSITFEISDIEHIIKVAKKYGIITICDNSWATPLLFKPLEHGVDIALYAVTKYLAGHSDLLMGAIITKEEEYFKLLYKNYMNYGITIQPQDCYLAHRGLRTLHTRMKKHQSTAIAVAKWLEKHPKIRKVLYPALPSHPQYELWKSYFKGASSVFSIVLDREYSCEELGYTVDHMEIFGIGASWGGCDSLILPIDRKFISRSVMNLDYGGSFIRIFCGLESLEDIISDLDTALTRLF